MAIRTEYEVWRDELAGKRTSIRGHLIATAIGAALAIILIIVERSI